MFGHHLLLSQNFVLKEILDQFGAVFAMLENNLFRDVVRSNIEFIFNKVHASSSNQNFVIIITTSNFFLSLSSSLSFVLVLVMTYLLTSTKIVQTPATIAMAQQFLTRTPVVARCFGEILLEFLLPRIPTLATMDKASAELVVKLFKLVFQSVTHLEDIESHLVPSLAKIVQSCTSQAETASDPTPFLTLLRGLFRAFNGGKFELIYSELLPLLPALLKNLNKQMLSVPNPKLRNIFAELCLTVPVRLSALLPHLRLLMGR